MIRNYKLSDRDKAKYIALMCFRQKGRIFMASSNVFKELTGDQIHRIVCDLYGFEVHILKYNILKGGYFNTTYFIKTDQHEKGIVIRVAPVNRHLLFDFEKDMMSAEPYFHNLLEENDIPTTKILKYVPRKVVIEREYIISEYLESVPMNDSHLYNKDINYVYEEVGRLARRMHSITHHKFGWARNSGRGEYDTWAEFVLSFAKEACEKAESHNLFCKEDIEKFRCVFDHNVDVLNEITTPFMVHTDLWQGNILLKETEERYNVAAIIDLDRTIFGDKYWDLTNPWIINADFLRGYKADLHETNHHKIRCNLYKLLGAFFCTYVTLIEYNDEKWFNKEKDSAVKMLSKF